MASFCRECAAKDQTIQDQDQMIKALQAELQRISAETGIHLGQIVIPAAGSEITHASDGSIQFPTINMTDEEIQAIQAYSEVHAVQFVPAPVITVGTLPNVIATSSVHPDETGDVVRLPVAGRSRVVQPRGTGAQRNGKSPKSRGSRPPRSRKQAVQELESVAVGEDAVDGFIDIQIDKNGDNVDSSNAVADEDRPEVSHNRSTNLSHNDGKKTHLLVLGSPHTRKIPLRCPLINCPHSDYRAWDRDLLRKHFDKYHSDSHPNPVFNYLCPYDGCKYISFNEPSYALYTHIKNVHREYLSECEKAVKQGLSVVERSLDDVYIEKLPSEIVRTPVGIVGTISMEKNGLKCPVPVCQGGSTVFKYSSIKKLMEHFQKLHSFTHPNPNFIFCCPHGPQGCNYTSEAGNFRIYKHLKEAHPDQYLTIPTVPNGEQMDNLEQEIDMIDPESNIHPVIELMTDGGEAQDGQAVEIVEHSEEPNISTEEIPHGEDIQPETNGLSSDEALDSKKFNDTEVDGTKIIVMGSANMTINPLKCPVPDCPRANFTAPSAVVMRRHFWRVHRHTHPNPVFFFACPAEGCDFSAQTDLWRHIRKLHPELLPKIGSTNPVLHLDVVEDAMAASGLGMENGEGMDVVREVPKPEEQIRAVAVQDVLRPGTLVKPFQLQCLYPACNRPPFSGIDKTQLMRHYQHYHPQVDRTRHIFVLCPISDCSFHCLWPPQPMYFHMESVHAPPSEMVLHPLTAQALVTRGNETPKSPSKLDTVVQTPIRIVGRQYASGVFFCPVPKCGHQTGVLSEMRNHVIDIHRKTHPNPVFIFACPIQGCSFAKQSNYQALSLHLQREHGFIKDRDEVPDGKDPSRTSKRKRDKSFHEESSPKRLAAGVQRESVDTEGISVEHESAGLSNGSPKKSSPQNARNTRQTGRATPGRSQRGLSKFSTKSQGSPMESGDDDEPSSSDSPPKGSDAGNALWMLKKSRQNGAAVARSVKRSREKTIEEQSDTELAVVSLS